MLRGCHWTRDTNLSDVPAINPRVLLSPELNKRAKPEGPSNHWRPLLFHNQFTSCLCSSEPMYIPTIDAEKKDYQPSHHCSCLATRHLSMFFLMPLLPVIIIHFPLTTCSGTGHIHFWALSRFPDHSSPLYMSPYIPLPPCVCICFPLCLLTVGFSLSVPIGQFSNNVNEVLRICEMFMASRTISPGAQCHFQNGLRLSQVYYMWG